ESERQAVLPRALRFQHRLAERAAAPRPHDFEMAKPRPAEYLRFGRVPGECGRHRLPHFVASAAAFDSGKSDDDPAAELAPPDLPRDDLRRRQIRRYGTP